MSRRRCVVLNEGDNVASALTELKRGEAVEVEVGGARYKVELLSDIPFGHKFALREIRAGEHVVKYGEVIGRATRDIEAGEHVHVQNVESLRARGDLEISRTSP